MDEDERKDARVASVLDGVRDELERQQTVDAAALRPVAWVNRHADAIDGHIQTD